MADNDQLKQLHANIASRFQFFSSESEAEDDAQPVAAKPGAAAPAKKVTPSPDAPAASAKKPKKKKVKRKVDESAAPVEAAQNVVADDADESTATPAKPETPEKPLTKKQLKKLKRQAAEAAGELADELDQFMDARAKRAGDAAAISAKRRKVDVEETEPTQATRAEERDEIDDLFDAQPAKQAAAAAPSDTASKIQPKTKKKDVARKQAAGQTTEGGSKNSADSRIRDREMRRQMRFSKSGGLFEDDSKLNRRIQAATPEAQLSGQSSKAERDEAQRAQQEADKEDQRTEFNGAVRDIRDFIYPQMTYKKRQNYEHGKIWAIGGEKLIREQVTYAAQKQQTCKANKPYSQFQKEREGTKKKIAALKLKDRLGEGGAGSGSANKGGVGQGVGVKSSLSGFRTLRAVLKDKDAELSKKRKKKEGHTNYSGIGRERRGMLEISNNFAKRRK